MEAQRVYIRIMRLSLKSTSDLSKRRIQELNAGIGELRQLLSCVVCCQLLMDPYKPKGGRCGHHVCRLCLRGRKRLVPSCTQCKDCIDFKTYEENKSMALQLLCYKTLCVHLLQSSLYVQLSDQRPNIWSEYPNMDNVPRIKLPEKSTQWFIQEGARYDDMCDTFLSQPELPFPKTSMPLSLPAETPPTTAATTPELPFEQHMPEQLSITDIELEAAATAEQADHFAHPLPMMTAGARMLSHNHIAPQPQQVLIPAGYMEPTWSEQVDLSSAFSLPSNYTTYVLPSGELQVPTIGQVVQLPQQQEQQQQQLPQATLEPAMPGGSYKRRHAELVADEAEQDEAVQEEIVPTSMTTAKRLYQKPTILSSVQVKPPAAVSATVPPVPAVPAVPAVPPVLVVPPVPAVPAVSQRSSATTSSTAKKTKTQERSAFQTAKATGKRRFCRCGTSRAPGPCTCRNGRCICYTEGYSCDGCKCVGCTNPHTYRGESSDEDEDEPTPTDVVESLPSPSPPKAAAAATGAAEIPSAAAGTAPAVAVPASYTLVPLDNLQQSQLPLVLIQNERGDYQGKVSQLVQMPFWSILTRFTLIAAFNMFNGTEPMDPTLAGFKRVPLQSNDDNALLQYAYVMPAKTTVEPEAETEPATASPPAKRMKHVVEPLATGETTRRRRLPRNYPPIESVDGLVSGSSRSNAGAGDGKATDKAHSLFEDIMSGSDNL
ncbi:hypothetical protein KR222_002181 [Zaprionus bogoriensis]|nr:hypothetical protein KR222_002181 [Zaprionus bogoriensis]